MATDNWSSPEASCFLTFSKTFRKNVSQNLAWNILQIELLLILMATRYITTSNVIDANLKKISISFYLILLFMLNLCELRVTFLLPTALPTVLFHSRRELCFHIAENARDNRRKVSAELALEAGERDEMERKMPQWNYAIWIEFAHHLTSISGFVLRGNSNFHLYRMTSIAPSQSLISGTSCIGNQAERLWMIQRKIEFTIEKPQIKVKRIQDGYRLPLTFIAIRFELSMTLSSLMNHDRSFQHCICIRIPSSLSRLSRCRWILIDGDLNAT